MTENIYTESAPLVDASSALSEILVHIVRLGLHGRAGEIEMYVRRIVKKHHQALPDLTKSLAELLGSAKSQSTPTRRESIAQAAPVDIDSRLQLLRIEDVVTLDAEPIFRHEVRIVLDQVVNERSAQLELLQAGLSPTKSLLFTGPPGVGKTLAAHWLAWKLQIPLMTLDLAAVMSSFLGRTGNNIRHVLDHAKTVPCILFLDEFDAIAKRRDDTTEVGELKRLVTVLLQEIDNWPASGLLVAATNHPDLLDPAIWRRFEAMIEFPKPDRQEAVVALRQWLINERTVPEPLIQVLASLLSDKSYSDMEREISMARRRAILHKQPADKVLQELVLTSVGKLPNKARQDIATQLVQAGYASQREVQALTGVSRDTIRKHLRSSPESLPET